MGNVDIQLVVRSGSFFINHGGVAAWPPREEEIRLQIWATVLLTQSYMAILPTWGVLSGHILNFANEETATRRNPQRVSSPVAAPPVPSASHGTPPAKNVKGDIVA